MKRMKPRLLNLFCGADAANSRAEEAERKYADERKASDALFRQNSEIKARIRELEERAEIFEDLARDYIASEIIAKAERHRAALSQATKREGEE